jgi:hypothetical protein
LEITRGIANWDSARDILENKEPSRGFEKINNDASKILRDGLG